MVVLNPRIAAESTVASYWLRLLQCTTYKKQDADLKKLFTTLDIGSHINAAPQLCPKAPGSQGMLPCPSPLDALPRMMVICRQSCF
jgi:hypothetical protein